jgi:hypothetical protein
MITADGNWSDLLKVADCMPAIIHGIVIPVPVILGNTGFKQAILDHPWETYAWKGAR